MGERRRHDPKGWKVKLSRPHISPPLPSRPSAMAFSAPSSAKKRRTYGALKTGTAVRGPARGLARRRLEGAAHRTEGMGPPGFERTVESGMC